MIRPLESDEDRRAVAAAWLARLSAPDVDVDEALAFDAWLAAAPANARAYDAALALSREIEVNASAIRAELAAASRSKPARRWAYPALGGLAAAAAALAVTVSPMLRSQVEPATYVTAVGQHRSVTLADGSKIDLNGGSRLTVVLRRHERDVRMDEGQAVFDVAADHSRPFLIAAGDRVVRVVGTQFDVRRRAGELDVTVTRGLVEVGPSDGAQGQTFRLHPGERLEHHDGQVAAQVMAAAPDQALGWRTGRLVYRGQPLGDVVADLNAQFATPVRVSDPALAATPISGVLILDDEDAVVRRLALLVSAKPVRSDAGVTLQRIGAPSR